MPESKRQKHRVLRRLAIASLLILAAVATLWPALRTVAPLVRTGAFVAHCQTPEGRSMPVTVYRAIGLPDRIYLHVPSAAETDYQWFAVYFRYSCVAVPNWPRSFGVTYVRTDQPSGVNLLDPKMQDCWQVVFSATRITFKNRSMDVSVRSTNDA